MPHPLRPPMPAPAPPFVVYRPDVDAHALDRYECEHLRYLAADSEAFTIGARTVDGSSFIDPQRLAVEAHLLDSDGPAVRMAQRLAAGALEANDVWGFDVTEASDLTVLRYEAGHEYVAHMDLNPEYPLRKVSTVAMLSATHEYVGGQLEVWSNGTFVPVPTEQGTVVIFPAYQPHRVTPVTSGERWALTCWLEGPRFR